MSDTSRSGPRWGRWRSILVGVLALAATVGSLLFFHRGLADFKGEPIGGWLCWRILALWGYTLTLSVACVSAGLRALAVFRPVEELPTLEALVTSAALGLVVFVFGMYLGGFARVFNAGFAVALPVAMTAAGAADALAFFRARHAAWRDDASPRDLAPRALGTLACVLGLLSIVVVYLGALTPEAINFDASWTHLPIAVDYARAHRIVPFPADYDRCVPHLASLVHTWAMLVPSLGLLDEAPLRWMLPGATLPATRRWRV